MSLKFLALTTSDCVGGVKQVKRYLISLSCGKSKVLRKGNKGPTVQVIVATNGTTPGPAPPPMGPTDSMMTYGTNFSR